ncbi:substrate-binding domain-containing protein [Amycolatopsis jejuensis]|uniref:substrate-binding domain-containing protein n=1 Tax=Amycolatopsis jejuensis TaxID=330084 RepID=UPI000A4F70E4|nr:substrate-binding domain-containing protein [Amycolatopsis jejuensis]
MNSFIRRFGALCAAGLAAAAVLTGCASGSASSGGKITIGVTLNAASNPFFLAEGKAIEEAAAAANISVSVQYANADVATQSNQIGTFIRQRVSSIVVDAADSEGIGPEILRAKQAGIPVVAIDVAATGSDASVTSDNVQAGRDACAYLFRELGGNGKIAIVDGSPVSAISDRMAGCKEALAKAPGIKVAATQRADLTRDKSMDVAGNIMAAHPDLDGFFGVNDPTAVGIALAAQQKGLKLKVVGVDGAKQLTDLFSGGLLIGTSGQDPAKLGRTGLDLAIKLAHGEKVSPAPVLIPTTLVTPDTIAKYRSWG